MTTTVKNNGVVAVREEREKERRGGSASTLSFASLSLSFSLRFFLVFWGSFFSIFSFLVFNPFVYTYKQTKTQRESTERERDLLISNNQGNSGSGATSEGES